MKHFFTFFLFLLSFYSRTNGYFVTIDAHAEACFFDRVQKGAKMGLIFEVAEGGFLDIDVRVTSPNGSVVAHGERESSGRYTFGATEDGDYTYCFSNQKSTMTPKVVKFDLLISEPSASTGEEEKAVDGKKPTEASDASLDSMIKELGSGLWGIKSEQEYMQVRDRNHRAINESTNYRVVLWSIFEALVLFCMTLGQVYYLKRFFEVRRVV